MIRQLHISEPGVRLTISTSAPLGQRGVIEVVAALECLSSLVDPLALELELNVVDPEIGFVLEPVELTLPYHQLR